MTIFEPKIDIIRLKTVRYQKTKTKLRMRMLKLCAFFDGFMCIS